MFELNSLARWLIGIGIGLAVLGGVLLLINRIPGLDRFGSLPGDIHFTSKNGRVTVFAPFASMILLSIILTIVLNVVIRLLRR